MGDVAAQGRNQRGGEPGSFDFYVLALSWSPGFCELDGGGERNREQCAQGAGLRFVVHGLWPQNERGYPSECGPSGRTPSRIALDQAKGLFPTEGLARYEWRKHGTCSGSSPSDYFADVRRAREKIVIPPVLAKAERDQSWTAIDLERAFVAANPGLRTDMMSVACKRGVLQEVRICLSKDLRDFRMCGEVDRSGCRTRDITVVAPR
ncbi:ribonuclease T [Bosea vaviloviae]|uniref:Ribonuclease T n=1 Tax=Bosea vaviloviae TaxID=1526658 RepID=A0A0N1F644_9HYPH|nr:ribonuclease T [Bosea vaviloviae]